jgi:hypothetical protein
MLPNMFLAYIRLIFRGSFVEITTYYWYIKFLDEPYNIIIITMAQQPYMGSGLLLPPLSEVTKSCAFVAVGDWPTDRATILSILMCPPEPSGRQSGDLGEKWRP